MPLMQREYDRKGKKRPLPSEPTSALPGSPEKVAVLLARLVRGEQRWHPDDAKVTLAAGGCSVSSSWRAWRADRATLRDRDEAQGRTHRQGSRCEGSSRNCSPEKH